MDTGYSAPDLGPLRKQWEDVRLELFGDAGWFRYSGADIDAAQTRPAPQVDRQHAFQLNRVIHIASTN